MTGSSPPPDDPLEPTSGPSPQLIEIRNLVAEASAHDWNSSSGEQLLEDVEELLRLTDRLDGLRMTVTAALDRSGLAATRGHRSCSALLKHRNRSRHAPRLGRDVHLGARLLHMPVTADAIDRGQITADHVRVLATCLDARFGGAFAGSEAMLVGFAADLAWSGFTRAINRWKEAADTAEPDLRDQKDLDAREVHLSRSFNDRGVLSDTLTPHGRQVFGAELERLTDQLWREDWAAATERLGEGNVTNDRLGRTVAQRRHDALILMAERSLGARGLMAEPTVYVHCSVSELEAALFEATLFEATLFEATALDEPPAPSEGDAGHLSGLRALREYEDETAISRRMLARLAIRGLVKRVVFDPAGRVVDISPGARLFSRRQREAIAVRDRVCACGCGLSARRCEADHIIEYRDGGLTVVDNAKPQCGPSHRLKTNRRNRQGPPTRAA